MSNEINVEVVLLRQRELEHYQLICRQFLKPFEDGCFEQRFGLGLLRTVNVHFRLDDGEEAGGNNLPGHFKLLVHDGLNAGRVGLLDDGAHLGSEDVFCVGLA